ncbi:MAG: ribonuclease BN [Haloferacaceae archaeon]
MTSLGEVYGPDARRETSTGRLYAGVALFSLGVLLVVAGIVVATTDLARADGASLYQAREYAGILAGVGVPAVFLGILTVLPADRGTRAAAGVGAAIAALGVGLFTHAYPCQWSGANCAATTADLTLPTVGTYFLGALITFWYLFVGIANFKRRNDPGGTARIEVTRQGRTEVVEVDPRKKGSIGFGKGTPDGSARTQTAGETGTTGAAGASADRDDALVMDDGPERSGGTGASATGGDAGTDRSTGRAGAGSASSGGQSGRTSTGPSASAGGPSASASTGGASSSAASDGGAAASDIQSFDDDRVDRDSVPGDPYCGNCEHFEYVRTERGMQPYCGYHGNEMSDMDPCEEWTSR